MDAKGLVNMFVSVFVRTIMRTISHTIINGGMNLGKRAWKQKKDSGSLTGPEDKAIGQLDNFRGPNSP
jgi:hypothetical protein